MKLEALTATLLLTLFASSASAAGTRYFQCASNGHECVLLDTKVEGSARSYEAEYTVHTKFDCKPGHDISNVVLTASPESKYRPYYDENATVSLVGYSLRLEDLNPDGSYKQTFYGACGLELTFEAKPSAGQTIVWNEQAAHLTSSLEDRTETVSYGPQLLFWQTKVEENPTKFYPFVQNLYNTWSTSTSLTQRIRAKSLKQVLDKVPRTEIEAGLTTAANTLRDLVAEARTFQATLEAASVARDAALDTAIVNGEKALPPVTP
jgi:hypothetical protein